MTLIISLRGSLISLCLLTASIFAARYIEFRVAGAPKVDIPIETLPMQLGEWSGRDIAGLGPRSREVLKVDRVVRRIYRNKATNHEVLLYIGYWSKQSGEHQAAKHSPAVCLPANGWIMGEREKKTISSMGSIPPLSVNVLSATYQQTQALFYYWFFSGAKTYTDEWAALAHLVFESFIHHRSDGGIVELSVNFDSLHPTAQEQEMIRGSIEDFLAKLQPELTKFIGTL